MSRHATTTGLPHICSLVTDGTHDSPKLQSSGVPFIKGKHISSGHVDFETCDFITEEDHLKCIKRVKPQVDDVLFANIGSVGDVARVVDERDFSIKNVALFRPDPAKVDPTYFYYLVLSPSFRGVFLNVRSGAAQPFISLDAFRSHRFPFNPDKAQQHKVGIILSAYDDLIENNRRRMALLEEAARTLYREWFVRLRFPGHEHTRITNGVPNGWERKTLGDFCGEIRESVSPDVLEPDTPYIGLEHMPRRSISLNDWGKAEQVTSSKHRFRAGELLFGKIRPYFHKVGIAFVDGVASSDAIVIRTLEDKLRGLVLMTVSSDEFVAVTAQTMKEGSKMPRADWKQMQQYLVLLPPDGLLNGFESIIQPLLEQLRTLSFANEKLRAGRDLLLPRLMSGEITV
jgi:type I restriction enzyme S subunit